MQLGNHYLGKTLTILALCCLPASAQTAVDGLASSVTRVLVEPRSYSTTELLSALDAEQKMLGLAASLAGEGEFIAAWKLVAADFGKGTLGTRDGITAERLGWRCSSVIGFMLNRGDGVEAERFARHVLAQPWCKGSPSDEVRFWCAQVVTRGMSDRKLALDWLGSGRGGESEGAKRLRERLQTEEKNLDPKG